MFLFTKLASVLVVYDFSPNKEKIDTFRKEQIGSINFKTDVFLAECNCEEFKHFNVENDSTIALENLNRRESEYLGFYYDIFVNYIPSKCEQDEIINDIKSMQFSYLKINCDGLISHLYTPSKYTNAGGCSVMKGIVRVPKELYLLDRLCRSMGELPIGLNFEDLTPTIVNLFNIEDIRVIDLAAAYALEDCNITPSIDELCNSSQKLLDLIS